MRKIRIIYFLYLIVITVVGCINWFSGASEPANITVFYADRQMMRLVPVSYNIETAKPQKQCDKIIEELTYDRGYNSNIRRLIPEEAVTVKVKDEVATVNIITEYFKDAEINRNYEMLIVYQLVNSVASVEGVSRVEFLIDGIRQKNFMGYIDMREVFIPDYYV